MPGIRYDVEVAFMSRGDLGLPTRNLTASLKSLERGFEGLGSGALQNVGSAIDGIGSALLTAAAAAGAGLAAGLAAVTVVATKMNAQLEETQISLAGIFMAADKASPWSKAMQIGGDVMSQMRKDAQALPGTFSELENMYQTMALSGFHAGASPMGFEKIAAKAMAVSKIMNLPTGQFAREMSGLIEGHAGQHNILGMRMLNLSGDSAKAFNAKPISERYSIVTHALSRYDEALVAYEHTFDAQSTTFVDNLKFIAAAFGGPVFESVKSALKEFNDWYSNNRMGILETAEAWGQKLANAFDVGFEKIKSWVPAIRQFASNAAKEITQIWDKVSPVLEKAGHAILGFAMDPQAFDKLKTFGEGALALRGVSAIGGPMMRNAGSLMANPEAFVGLGISAIAAAGALDVLADDTNQFHDGAMKSIESIKGALMGESGLGEVKNDLIVFADALGAGTIHLAAFTGRLITFLDDPYKYIKDTVSPPELNSSKTDEAAVAYLIEKDRQKQYLGTAANYAFNAGAERENTRPPKTNVHIGTIHFNFAPANEDPSRIARRIESTLVDLARRSKSSRRGLNGASYR